MHGSSCCSPGAGTTPPDVDNDNNAAEQRLGRAGVARAPLAPPWTTTTTTRSNGGERISGQAAALPAATTRVRRPNTRADDRAARNEYR